MTTEPIGAELAELRFHGNHPRKSTCPHCNKDVATTAITKLAYAFEVCHCDFATYAHLVERIWHRDCVRYIRVDEP